MRGMPKPPSPFDAPSDSSAGSFQCGDQVALVALQSQPKLNGRVAFVGAFDSENGRFEVHLSPMRLDVGATGGMKMNWVDMQADSSGAAVIKVKPTSMQGINLAGAGGPAESAELSSLSPAQRVSVLRAQKALWDDSTLFKDGKRRAPNVVALFRPERQPRVALVRDPPAGVVPSELLGSRTPTIVVRRALDAATEGVDGFIYVIASAPRVLMSYRRALAADGGVLEGKPAADAYLAMQRSI